MRAGCVFFLVVRRIYRIIIGRRSRYFGCVFRGRGCRRLSKPTVVCRFFRFDVRVDVRVVCRCRTSGYVGFVSRCLRRVGTCCLMGFVGSGILYCSAYSGVINCYFFTFVNFSLASCCCFSLYKNRLMISLNKNIL